MSPADEHQQRIEQVRAEHLAPGIIHRHATSGQPVALAYPPGLGKTEALIRYLASGMWRRDFDVVIWLAYSRDLMSEVALGLTRLGVPSYSYPALCEAPCQPDNRTVTGLVRRGLGLYVQHTICSSCRWRDGCRWNTKRDVDAIRRHDIIIAPEQLLQVQPGIIASWGRDRRVLLVIDEAKCGQDGFVMHFSATCLEREVAAAANAGYAKLSADLRLLARSPSSRIALPEPLEPYLPKIEAAGAPDPDYRPVIRQVRDYLADPLRYHVGDDFVYTSKPCLPEATIFLGAYLDGPLLAAQYGLQRVHRPDPPPVPIHPGGRIVHLRGAHGSLCRIPGNLHGLAALAADLIRAACSAGGRPVILCSKHVDHSQRAAIGELVTALNERLERMGLPQRVSTTTELAGRDAVVPLLTYGAIGTNQHKDETALIAINAYHITPEALDATALGHLPPRARPRFTITPDRRLVFHDPADDATRELMARSLRQLEVEPVLQAVHRLRPILKPRQIFLLGWQDFRADLGESATVVEGFADARTACGLGSATAERQRPGQACLLAALQAGATYLEAAQAAGVSERTARRWAALIGAPRRRRGRPSGGST